ncbi:hypothetical protein KSP40_PGU014625 [Platanthera guangdongensis]|uniref:Rhodanese domain-containing protein n=1 Tax=Platanthera guangdongensis TaxID=2320717 RepID=A0ABR2LHV6_9ASPA
MAYSQFARAFVGLKSIRRSPPFLQESRSFSSFARVSFSHEAMILHIIRLQYIVFLILSERSTYFIHMASPSLVSSNIAAIHCSTTGSSGSTVPTSFDSTAHDESVVSPDWLQDNLRKPDVKVLDASWYMPDEKRNPFQEYQAAHIPGALFFDVDGISDRKSNLPHMLPSEEAFAAAVSALDIHNKDGVVVYDGKGIFSAARVWWMFRVFGHDKVWVLDGGLPHWRASGFDVESIASGDAILKSNAAVEAVEKVYKQKPVGRFLRLSTHGQAQSPPPLQPSEFPAAVQAFPLHNQNCCCPRLPNSPASESRLLFFSLDSLLPP